MRHVRRAIDGTDITGTMRRRRSQLGRTLSVLLASGVAGLFLMLALPGLAWADTIEQWNGNATSQLTSCFLQNLPGGLMSVKSTRFREVDR